MQTPDRTLAGIISLCVGVAVFPVQDVILKSVSGAYPLTEAMAIRAVVALILLGAVVWQTEGFAALRPNAAFLTLRAFVLFIAYFSYYLALPALPLADAAALYFTVPIFIVLMAGPYLGEKSNWLIWVSLGMGLAGTLITLQPGVGVFEPAALLSLIAAITYGFAQLMARKVGATTSAPVFSLYQNALYLVAALVVAGGFASLGFTSAPHPSMDFMVRPWVMPTVWDFGLMCFCGVIAAIGTVLLVNGYRLAPASSVGIFEYTGIIWLSLYGWLALGEVPKFATVIGALFIVIAGLLAIRAQKID